MTSPHFIARSHTQVTKWPTPLYGRPRPLLTPFLHGRTPNGHQHPQANVHRHLQHRPKCNQGTKGGLALKECQREREHGQSQRLVTHLEKRSWPDTEFRETGIICPIEEGGRVASVPMGIAWPRQNVRIPAHSFIRQGFTENPVWTDALWGLRGTRCDSPSPCPGVKGILEVRGVKGNSLEGGGGG